MAEEQAAKKEEQGTETAAQGEKKSDKNKKINRLSSGDINSKIENLEKTNQIRSKYYKHLLDRRNELQSL